MAQRLRFYAWHPIAGLDHYHALEGPVEAEMFAKRMEDCDFPARRQGVDLYPWLTPEDDPPDAVY